MQIIDGVPVWGAPVDEGALTQIKVAKEKAHAVALMADHHLGYSVPIGGVVAYDGQVSPSGVGFDIACGNKCVLTDATVSDVRRDIKKIMDEVVKVISFGIGRSNNEEVDHQLFDWEHWKMSMLAPLKQMARNQLGTVGSGNHYVDIFEDEQHRVWIGNHFGSRGLGHKIATYFLKEAGGKDGMHVEPAVVDVNNPLGGDYLQAMELAGAYAYAGRNWVADRVAKILGAKILDSVHNHHNYAWYENHEGKDLWVVRKGATPAFPGQKGFIGGSMGESAVIVEGVLTEDPAGLKQQELAMFSTVHGAGRVMGRMEAKGKKNKKGEVTREGKISELDMMKWVHQAGVELRGAGVDEAPQAYKRLPEVLAEHAETIRVLHTLTPIGVAMAGPDVVDPFKD